MGGDVDAEAEENIVFSHVTGFAVCDQFGSADGSVGEAWVGGVEGVDDDERASLLYVVSLVFLATSILVVYALVVSAGCCDFRKGLDEEREKPVVYESEY